MKLPLLLCLISFCAFAQTAKPDADKKIIHHTDSTRYNFISDSLSMDISWDDIFRSSGYDCRCTLSPEQVQQMPRELSPYKWVDKNKPILIDEQTYQQWMKADQDYKKMYRRADSIRKAQDSIRVNKKKPAAL